MIALFRRSSQTISFLFCLAITLLTASAVNAASIKVLWYGQNDFYNSKMTELAAAASTYDPEGDGSLQWDLTFFNPGDSTPNFYDYNVFVIGTGGYDLSDHAFDPAGILKSKTAIQAARGSRTFLSGQDADTHYMRGAGGRTGESLNGPFGFLVNAVNWAASGTGMGIVSLPDGWYPTNNPRDRRWWLNDNSFLKDELQGYVASLWENKVVIPTETSTFPVNEGLTTTGLSNWQTSAHRLFNKNIPGYVSINDAGSHPGYAVTIVTASEADGSTSGPRTIPEPSSGLGLLAFGTFGATSLLKGKRQQKVLNCVLTDR